MSSAVPASTVRDGVAGLCRVALVVLGCGCVSSDTGAAADGLAVGVLLPFTGDNAATGPHLEQAIVLAAEQIAAAGGVAGRPLRLATRDTHSLRGRGLDAARELLGDEEVLAIVGPDNETLAKVMVELVAERSVVQICGDVTSPAFAQVADDGYWFRTNPSAVLHARALVARMVADGVQSASILAVGDEFGLGFARAVKAELLAAGIATSTEIPFNPTENDFSQALDQLRATDAEAVVLAAYPGSGAAIVLEWTAAAGRGRFYLSPSLKQEAFVLNLPAGVLEGVVGVTTAVDADPGPFITAYSARWFGEQPSASAHSYYDAVVLAALAMESAARVGPPARSPLLRDEITRLANPPGEAVGWQDLERAFALVRAGQDIDYQGASGPLDLDERGELVGGKVGFWTIQGDRIVDL
jgi:ABC-type branched-subunit amino acid transport system substrate-binding protein